MRIFGQGLSAVTIRRVTLFWEGIVDIPESVELSSGDRPEGTVIWLHGLGADGHDFEPIVPEFRLDGHADIRFIFPHAPVRPVTINGGTPMRAWYDVVSLDRAGPQDEPGIRDSASSLRRLIEREHERGIEYGRVVLAGFSQGGAIAMHTALRFPERLAGLMALSTWLPLESTIEREVIRNAHAQPRDLPVLMAHGSFDPMLPIGVGQHARDIMRKAGFEVQWHDYPMAHAVCADEIAEIRKWLLNIYAD